MDRRKLIHQLSAQVFDALELNPPTGVTADEVRAFRARHEATQRASLYEQFKHLGAAPAPGQRGHKPPDPADEAGLEAARSMLDAALGALDTAELRWAWDHALALSDAEVLDENGESYDLFDDERGLFDDGEGYGEPLFTLVELIGPPGTTPDGAPLSDAKQRELAMLAVDLAVGMRPLAAGQLPWLVGGAGEHARDVSDAGGLHGLPRWLAEAVLADALRPKLKLQLVTVSREDAAEFIRRHHSKLPHVNQRGLLFALGVARGGRVVAVATVNTPSGRWAEPHGVVEVSRIASDGTVKGAASKLMARILDVWQRAARYEAPPTLLVTYSLSSEDGVTYRALKDRGLRPTVKIPGREPGGARAGGADSDLALARIDKVRWEAGPAAGPADWSLTGQGRRTAGTRVRARPPADPTQR